MWRMVFIPQRLGRAGRFMKSKQTALPFGFDLRESPPQPETLRTLLLSFFEVAKNVELGSDDLSDMLRRCEVYLGRDY